MTQKSFLKTLENFSSKFSNFHKKYFIAFGFSLLFLTVLFPSSTLAAARTASVTGAWNNTATWGGSSIPGSSDSVTIGALVTVTVPSGYAAQCTTIAFSTSAGASTITLADATASLTASGAVTIARKATDNTANTLNVGAGTFTGASLALSGTTGSRLTEFTISTGTATITANITSAGGDSHIIFSGAGTLKVGGTFMSGGTVAGLFTASTGTVNFNGSGSQTIAPYAYTFNNVIFSNAGSKTIGTNATINGNLSIAPTGTAKADITAGLNKTVASLTLGGNGTTSGTWGSTAAILATYHNDTYFTSTTGYLTVTTSTLITTTTALATSLTPQTYGSSVTFTATVTPSIGGAPTGTVTFKDGLTTIGTGTLNGANPGVATYSTSSLSVIASPHSITAVYAGDGTHTGSTSSAVSQVISKKALTLSAMSGDSKPYDGNNTANLTGGTLTGKVGSDSVSVSSITATYDNKNFGTGKTITISAVTLGGADASNYTVTVPFTISTGVITKLALTVSAMSGTSKPYDGNNTANLSGGTLGGVIGLESVNVASISSTYDTATAGTGKTITISAVTLGGADQANYTVTVPFAISTGVITTANQATLIAIVNPSTVTYGTTAALSSSGGSGTGAVTFSVGLSTGCNISGGTTLNVIDASGTCAVTATKAGDTNYNEITSSLASVTLAKANQATLTAIVTPSTVAFGTTAELTYSGGSGTGSVTFSVGGSTGCNITLGTTLNVSDASGTCAVTATRAADTNYNVANSAPVTVTLTKANQATLTATVTPSTLAYGSTATLGSSGGSGSGTVTYSAGGSTGCNITLGTTLNVSNASGTCSVTATKAGDSDYEPKTSDAVLVTLEKANQSPLTAIVTPSTITFGNTAALTKSGGSGTGAVTFSVGASTGCNITGGTVLNVSNASESCAITATMAADANYYEITSSPASVTLEKANQSALTAVVTPSTVAYGSTAVLSSLGGSSSGDVTFSAGLSTGCNITLGTTLNVSDVSGTCGVTATKAGDSNYNVITSDPVTVTLVNPVPVISTIDPSSKHTTDPDFTLTVNGSNFIPSSTVNFNGGARVTTFVNTGRLTALIPASDMLLATSSARITVTNSAPGGGVSNYVSFSVTYSATKFVILTDATHSVDSPVTVTVQAQKADGSIDTSYVDDVTLLINGSAVGAGLVNISGGTGSRSVTHTVAEPIHLSLSDTEHTTLNVDSTADVTFHGGATTQFSLNSPTPLSAGSRAAYTVTRKDQFGNLTSQGDITVNLSSNGGANKKFYDSETGSSVITSIIIPDGQQSINFWYYDETPGSITITASGTSGISNGINVLSVVPGAVSSFTLSGSPAMTAKTRIGYTVVRKDQFANLVTSGSSVLNLSTTAGVLGTNRFFYDASTGGTSITSITIADGSSSASFWYYEETSGNYTVTASNGVLGVTDGTIAVLVNPAPIVATKLIIQTPIASGTVDGPITITVKAVDDAGNVDTTISGNVTLNTTGSATPIHGSVPLNLGVGTIDISDHTAETTNLSLSDTEHPTLDHSSTASAVFATGTVAQIFLVTAGDTAAGDRLQFTVTRKDQYGNLITSGVTPITLNTSSLSANRRFYDSAIGGSVIPTTVNILDGNSTVNFWYYDELADSVTVTASIGAATATKTFNVLPGAIAKFFIDHPGNMTAGTRLEYTITRTDAYDNPVTSGIVSANISTDSGSASGKFYDAVTGGFTTSVAVFAEGNSEAHVWYYEEALGTWTITVSDGPTITSDTDSVLVSSSSIVATRFIIQPVTNSTVNIPVTVTVRAEDGAGNVDATYNHNVTLHTTGSATGAGVVTIINGVGTIDINDAVAETITLSLVDSSSTGLNILSTRTLTFDVVAPIVSVGGGGGTTVYYNPAISGIHFTGKAFPGANLNVIAIGGAGGTQNQTGVANTTASFNLSFNGLTGNARSYAVVGIDKNNNATQVKIFDANMANANLQLDVNGILLSPTLALARTAATKGDVLGISGEAAPNYKVEIEVDNQPILPTVTADANGHYKALVPTVALDFGSHTIRTRQISPAGLKSDYSPQEIFSVVNIFTPNMDFSGDGIVNITDWSMFVVRWQSTDAKVRIKDDLNGDGKVDVQDLSIFVRTLKLK